MTLSTGCHRLITDGPLVDVEIRPHPKVDTSGYVALWGKRPSVKVTLLVDTGTRHSLIDREVFESLNLDPISNLGEVATAAGELHEQPIYLIEMHMTVSNGHVSLPTAAVGLQAGPLLSRSPYRGVLGRDWLQKTRFVYDGSAGSFGIEVVKK